MPPLINFINKKSSPSVKWTALVVFIGSRAASGPRTAVINSKGTPAHHHAAHQHVITAFLHCASSFGKFPEILMT
ncbi:MAG: hypothetical protein M0Q12_12675, partial [Synergistaceae bacterium]|nr:hypothetical protein [Synergistaceae bacterium]